MEYSVLQLLGNGQLPWEYLCCPHPRGEDFTVPIRHDHHFHLDHKFDT